MKIVTKQKTFDLLMRSWGFGATWFSQDSDVSSFCSLVEASFIFLSVTVEHVPSCGSCFPCLRWLSVNTYRSSEQDLGGSAGGKVGQKLYVHMICVVIHFRLLFRDWIPSHSHRRPSSVDPPASSLSIRHSNSLSLARDIHPAALSLSLPPF